MIDQRSRNFCSSEVGMAENSCTLKGSERRALRPYRCYRCKNSLDANVRMKGAWGTLALSSPWKTKGMLRISSSYNDHIIPDIKDMLIRFTIYFIGQLLGRRLYAKLISLPVCSLYLGGALYTFIHDIYH